MGLRLFRGARGRRCAGPQVLAARPLVRPVANARCVVVRGRAGPPRTPPRWPRWRAARTCPSRRFWRGRTPWRGPWAGESGGEAREPARAWPSSHLTPGTLTRACSRAPRSLPRARLRTCPSPPVAGLLTLSLREQQQSTTTITINHRPGLLPQARAAAAAAAHDGGVGQRLRAGHRGGLRAARAPQPRGHAQLRHRVQGPGAAWQRGVVQHPVCHV